MQQDSPVEEVTAITHTLSSNLQVSATPLEWSALISQRFVGLSAEPTDQREFVARIAHDTVCGIDVSNIEVAGQSVRRTREQIRNTYTDKLYLVWQLSGQSQMTHEDGCVELSSGGMLMLDPQRPYVLQFDGRSRQICVQLPQFELLERLGSDTRVFAGRLFDYRAAAVPVVKAAFRHLIEESLEPDLQLDTAQEIFFDVLAGALRGMARDAGESAYPSERNRWTRFQSYLLANFKFQDVSPTSASCELGCSVRTLHTMLQCRGTTFMQELTALRLDWAARELRGARPGEIRISDVAFASGFGDLSHFSRRFKQRFELTPKGLLNRK